MPRGALALAHGDASRHRQQAGARGGDLGAPPSAPSAPAPLRRSCNAPCPRAGRRRGASRGAAQLPRQRHRAGSPPLGPGAPTSCSSSPKVRRGRRKGLETNSVGHKGQRVGHIPKGVGGRGCGRHVERRWCPAAVPGRHVEGSRGRVAWPARLVSSRSGSGPAPTMCSMMSCLHRPLPRAKARARAAASALDGPPWESRPACHSACRPETRLTGAGLLHMPLPLQPSCCPRSRCGRCTTAAAVTRDSGAAAPGLEQTGKSRPRAAAAQGQRRQRGRQRNLQQKQQQKLC